MVRKAFLYLLALLVMVPAMSSCIRDEIQKCPPLRITLKVKDKNYFNVDAVVNKGLIDRKDENLPFREYISTLFYIVRDEAGNIIEKRDLANVAGDEKEMVIQLPVELPYGKYSITVWGNIKSRAPLDENFSGADLEHADAAKQDVYMASAVLQYEMGSENHIVELERAKGLLIVQAENLPDFIDSSEKTVSNVYRYVAEGFKYDRLTDIYSRTEWNEKNNIVTYSFTGPSKGFESSSLKLQFLNSDCNAGLGGDNICSLKPESIGITMIRNSITVVKYVYADNNKFDIYVLVNDNWEEVHGLIIEE